MKKRNRAVIFATATLLTVGILNYSDFESKAKATDQRISTKNEVLTPDKSTEYIQVKQTEVKKSDDTETSASLNTSSQRQSEDENKKLDTEKSIEKDQSPVKPKTNKAETEPVAIQPVENKSVTQNEKDQSQTTMPETKIIDGYTYVNLMDRVDENLMDLVSIAKKHDATLYAIEYSDCFAMFDNNSDQAIILFSTGSRSASVENVDILYDMHPYIKNQIQGVVETGEEAVVKIGEHESYHISKVGGNIQISF